MDPIHHNTYKCGHRSPSGGGALFSDLTTVGTLFGLLRYVHWTQRGMKQTSNSYARIMAGLG